MIDNAGIGTLPYDKEFNNYRIVIPHEVAIDDHRQLLADLMTIAKTR